MIIKHIWGLFSNPIAEWETIRDEPCTVVQCYARHVMVLAAIPAVSGLIGTTTFGIHIGFGEPAKLTFSSASVMALITYLAMLVAVYSIAYMIHWMGKTYGTDQPFSRAVLLSAYTVTPLFLVGLVALYPLIWLNLILGIPALTYTVFLLYTGLPIMMGVNQEQGFLYSSAVLGVGLVTLVSLLAATVILWGLGFGPAFAAL